MIEAALDVGDAAIKLSEHGRHFGAPVLVEPPSILIDVVLFLGDSNRVKLLTFEDVLFVGNHRILSVHQVCRVNSGGVHGCHRRFWGAALG